jgi:hypothetical protein
MMRRVLVGPMDLGGEREFDAWVAQGVAFAGSLPAKG